MIVRPLLTLAAAALCCLPPPAFAAGDASADFRQLKAGDPVQLRADRAYLLLRMDTSLSKFPADLLRVPTDAEVAAYDAARAAAYAKAGPNAGPIDSFVFDYRGRPNLYGLTPNKQFDAQGKTVVVLAEVTPADYVLYGTGSAGTLYQCLCLGTVGFTAKAGEITDLGTMIVDYASKPSRHPELAGEAGLGPSASADFNLFAVAVRPRGTGDAVPAALQPSYVEPARFHAVGPFVEPGAMLINRLAPIPGVLAYQEGRVIDVASGAEALPR